MLIIEYNERADNVSCWLVSSQITAPLPIRVCYFSNFHTNCIKFLEHGEKDLMR